jgi:hypothetical protein
VITALYAIIEHLLAFPANMCATRARNMVATPIFLDSVITLFAFFDTQLHHFIRCHFVVLALFVGFARHLLMTIIMAQPTIR